MAATDARPLPLKNVAFRLYAPIYDADGDPVSGPAGLDSEVSKDGGAFADCTNEWTEIGTSGIGFLDLTSTEMNADAVVVRIQTSTSGAKTTVVVMYPAQNTSLPVNVVAVSGATTAADNAELFFDGTGYNAANSAIGTVASVTAVATGGITAGSIATDAIGAAELAADAVAEIADAVWDEALSGHTGAGSFGRRMQIVRDGTAQAGAAGTITLDASASASNDFYNDSLVFLVGGTGAGQARLITDYVGSTKVASVAPNWVTNPDNTSVFVIQPAAQVDVGQWADTATAADDIALKATLAKGTDITGFNDLSAAQVNTEVDTGLADYGALRPTVAGRTLDVTTTGEAGIDWANVGGPTTVQNLSGTTVKTATDVETDTADIQTRLPAALVSGRIDSSVGAMAAGVVTAAAVATGAIDADALAADAVAEVADGVWDEAMSGHTTVGTFGQAAQAIRTGTAQAGAAGTITLDAGASGTDDFYNNALIVITGGAGAGQARFITDYVGSTKVASVGSNWLTNPSSTSEFVIVPFGAIPGATAPTASEVADAVWDEAISGHLSAGSTGEKLNSASAPSAATVADAVWDEARADHTAAGSFGQGVASVQGNLTGSIGSLGSTAKADVNAEVDAALDTAIPGSPTANSINERVKTMDDAYTATRAGNLDNLDAAVSTRSTVTTAQVNTEVDTAIADARLDELLAADSDIDGAAPPTVGSVFHELMSKSAGSFTYDQTTDSLEAIRDKEADIETDTQDIQGRLPAALVSGHIDASVGAMAANTVTASAVATDAVTEIQSGLATATALAVVDDFVDTEVAAIKAVTDKLDTAVELDGAVYRFTTNALEMAPAGGGGGGGDWTAAEREQIRDALGVNGTKTAATGGQLQAVKAKTDTIGAGVVQVFTPMTVEGDMTVIQGHTYDADYGNAFEWLDPTGTTWPDLTGATIKFYYKYPGDLQTEVETGSGSVVTPTGANKKVRVEMTAANSAAIPAYGYYDYKVVATLQGSSTPFVLARKKLDVKDI